MKDEQQPPNRRQWFLALIHRSHPDKMDDSGQEPLPPPHPPSEEGESSPQSAGILNYIIGVPLGFLAHFVYFVVTVIGFYSRRGDNSTAIIVSVIFSVVSIAVAMQMSRQPATAGFGYGMLLGVALTALLTAQCALSS